MNSLRLTVVNYSFETSIYFFTLIVFENYIFPKGEKIIESLISQPNQRLKVNIQSNRGLR